MLNCFYKGYVTCYRLVLMFVFRCYPCWFCNKKFEGGLLAAWVMDIGVLVSVNGDIDVLVQYSQNRHTMKWSMPQKTPQINWVWGTNFAWWCKDQKQLFSVNSNGRGCTFALSFKGLWGWRVSGTDLKVSRKSTSRSNFWITLMLQMKALTDI